MARKSLSFSKTGGLSVSLMAMRRSPIVLVAIFLGSMLCVSRSRAEESADDCLQAALTADKHFDSRQALELYRKADQLKPNDPFILQRISKELSDSTLDATDLGERKRLIMESLDYAERAVKLEPKNAVNVLSLAICHGKLALYSDLRPKVTYSRMVKEEAERALVLDPNYDWAHHVAGRWNYEVASLGAPARFFVRLIYGGLPDASYQQAIAHLERAVELSPQVVSHHVELGYAYWVSGKKDEARQQFNRGLSLPSRVKYDQEEKDRASKALAALK